MLKKINKLLHNPFLVIPSLGHRGFFNWMSDESYIKLVYLCRMHRRLNLDTPKTYNEKLQWLKLHDRNPLYTDLVDKYEVRKYISNKIGEEYLIPLLGVWDNFDDIDFNSLPEQFVLKCTHDSGGLVICKDKSTFNINTARKKLNNCLKYNFYWDGREWPYRDIKPRIIAEKYMVDESGTELKDYKLFCFHGEVKALFVARGRPDHTTFDFYDLDFQRLPVKQYYPNGKLDAQKPKGFSKMIELSKKLSDELIHVRVDLYDIKGSVYFGELTFYHFDGMERFEPDSFDQLFGSWLKLPQKEVLLN